MFLQSLTKLVFVDRNLRKCQSLRPQQKIIRQSAYITVGRRVNSGTGWFDHLVERSWRFAEGFLELSREGLGGYFCTVSPMSRRVSDAVVASIGVDELFTRFISKLRCKFVPMPTDLDRRKIWKRRGRRLATRYAVTSRIASKWKPL